MDSTFKVEIYETGKKKKKITEHKRDFKMNNLHLMLWFTKGNTYDHNFDLANVSLINKKKKKGTKFVTAKMYKKYSDPRNYYLISHTAYGGGVG